MKCPECKAETPPVSINRYGMCRSCASTKGLIK